MAGHGNTSYLIVFNGAELARRGDQRIASNECRRTKNYSMGLYRMGLRMRAWVVLQVCRGTTPPLVTLKPALSARNLLAAGSEAADSSRDNAALRNDNSFGDFQITP